MDLNKLRKLDPLNRAYLADYTTRMELDSLAPNTIDGRLWHIYSFLIWFGFRDLKTVKPKEIEKFYLTKRKQNDSTAFTEIMDLKLILEWLMPGNSLITFKPRRPRREIPPEKVMASDIVLQLLRVCDNQRDRALVSLYWDSAARLSELIDTNIGHVTFDRYGAVISVKGKTGRRGIRLVQAVPDLQAWVNIHPMRDDPNAPLFTTLRKRGKQSFVRMDQRTVQNLFRRLRDLAGVSKKCNPHSFRHGRLTARGRQLTESELREYAGWSRGSSMAAVYVHLSGRDIDDKILAVDGVVQEEEPAPDPMAQIECPRCKHRNPPDTMFCGKCSMMLTEEAIREHEILKAFDSDPAFLADVMAEIARRKAGS